MRSAGKSLKHSSPFVTASTISVAEAKANFSSVLSNVERGRTPVTILRRGQPIAQIIPLNTEPASLYGSMRGTVRELGDIVGPTGVEWTVSDDE